MQDIINKARAEDTEELCSDYIGKKGHTETSLETKKRRAWAIGEEKFRRQIKKIHSSASISVNFLDRTFLIVLLVLAYMVSIGTPATTVIAGIATLMGLGGGPGLAYRYLDKRRQDNVNKEKSTPITLVSPIENAPKPLPGEED
jgi:hypothetical protein